MAEQLEWKFTPWSEDILNKYWSEIGSEHEEPRAFIADALELSVKMNWRPVLSIPTAETFVRESRILPWSHDIMGICHGYRLPNFLKIVEDLDKWREDRFVGARAPSSTYDRVGGTIIRWLFQGLHDINANQMYQYILPLMPELFRMNELNDSPDLAARAQLLLIRMSGVTPPVQYVEQVLSAIFKAIQDSPSWRIRLSALPVLQVFYFRQSPLINDDQISRILEVVCLCLNDEVVEVREMAATTLSGILRCSPRKAVLTLKDRFVQVAASTILPPRKSPGYALALRTLHAAILGVTALIGAFPYNVPSWCPALIADVLSVHMYDPVPISSTVRKCASSFKETHQDTWAEDCLRFNEDQLSALTAVLAGSSYYA